MKTHYIGHDLTYQKKKEKGRAGWDPKEVSDEVLKQFKTLLDQSSVPKRGSLLELGCGAGNLSVGFAQWGYDVTGVDISPFAVQWAQERGSSMNLNIEFIVDNLVHMQKLKRKNKRFELAIDSHLFHCLIGADRTLFLKNTHSLLNEKGILIINTMCQNEKTHEFKGFEKNGLIMHEDIATRYIGTADSISQEITKAGFLIKEIKVESSSDLADDLLIIAEKHA